MLRAQRVASIGTLAGGIAHDLNNILAPIAMSVQLLQEKITDPEGRALLALLKSSVQRAVDLVSQVLAFGRGVEGQRIPVNLNHLIGEIQKIIRETFPKNLTLAIRRGGELGTVTGDVWSVR